MVTTDQIKADIDKIVTLVEAVELLTPGNKVENTIITLLQNVENNATFLAVVAALINMLQPAPTPVPTPTPAPAQVK